MRTQVDGIALGVETRVHPNHLHAALADMREVLAELRIAQR
ncbi:hypothetical protein ABT218_36645 [Streptomyces sp. NPDC001455]